VVRNGTGLLKINVKLGSSGSHTSAALLRTNHQIKRVQ